MKILALEFSTSRRSVVLVEDGKVIRAGVEEARRGVDDRERDQSQACQDRGALHDATRMRF